MKRTKRDNPETPEPEAPKGLTDDLAGLYRMDVSVPAEVDERILAQARERLSQPSQTRRRTFPMHILRWALPAGAAAAAAVLVVLWLGAPKPDIGLAATRQDIDGSGRVDILDAFALARRIETTAEPAKEWDMNRDGIVDELDVNTIAMSAVSLNQGALR